MKLYVNGGWYTPYKYYNMSFEDTHGATIEIPEGAAIHTDYEKLYKTRDGGGLMEFSWRIIRVDTKFYLAGTIAEEGRKDRTYTSVVKSAGPGVSPLLRALNDLRSKWEHKQKRDGWRIEGAPEVLREPMLLHKWEDAKKREGPWLVSPKLDGIRGTYNVELDQIISRKRTPFALSYICKQLQELGVAADGELWHPEYDWETISGTVSRDLDHENVLLKKRDLQFHIFDRADMPDVPYLERLASLIDLDIEDRFPNLFIVPSIYCKDEEEVQRIYKQLVDAKYEGAVARTLTGLYKNDNRSWDVLKIKPVHSKEFLLHSIVYDEDPKYGRLISYILRTDNGDTFKATPANSKEERAQDYLAYRLMYLNNKWVTVEYRDTYASGIPKHAIAKGFRNMNT